MSRRKCHSTPLHIAMYNANIWRFNMRDKGGGYWASFKAYLIVMIDGRECCKFSDADTYKIMGLWHRRSHAQAQGYHTNYLLPFRFPAFFLTQAKIFPVILPIWFKIIIINWPVCMVNDLCGKSNITGTPVCPCVILTSSSIFSLCFGYFYKFPACVLPSRNLILPFSLFSPRCCNTTLKHI